MKKIEVQPVIMAGGSGTRLWPQSRAGYPEAVSSCCQGNFAACFQQAAARLAVPGAPPEFAGR